MPDTEMPPHHPGIIITLLTISISLSFGTEKHFREKSPELLDGEFARNEASGQNTGG
jgi:hypothetical protein